MYYPEELVEEIRERNDIVEVIGTYVKLQKKGSSYFGLCPFHNEKSPSFSVSPDKQMYYCFGCGAGGNVFTFIMEYENYSFPEALKYLADRVGIKLPEREYSEEEKRQQDLRMQVLEINKMAANYFYYQLRTESGAQAMQYLKSRQLDDETIKRFALGYSSKYSSNLYQYFKSKKISDELLKESGLFNVDEKNGMYDKFWNRVIFPILDVNNRVIGFGGRVMGDGKPKYLNSPETIVFDKSRNLYGLNIARAARKKYLLVCEGYMDVISMHQAGFSNAVASLGTALTEKHATLLKRYTDEVILTYDSDDAGVRAALRAIPIVKRAGLRARVLHMNPYKDPDGNLSPFIVRSPSISSMDTKVFLFPTVITDRYCFMRTMRKEVDFTTFKGFLGEDLVYDKQENALFSYILYNDDFINKEEVSLTSEPRNPEIAICQTLDAPDLVEAYEKGQLKGKLKEIAANLDEESNPVVMLLKKKK